MSRPPTASDGPTAVDAADVLDTCADRALSLLRDNVGPRGVRAASPDPVGDERNYDAVFARDHAICALGMAATGDDALLEAAWTGLRTLASARASSGEIPKMVRADGQADFWYVACADATIWWLLTTELLARLEPASRTDPALADALPRARAWLRAQVHPAFNLVRQNEASDWADIFPRRGFVLYTNALWCWLLTLTSPDEVEPTRQSARALLRPHNGPDPPERRLLVSRTLARRHTAPSPFWLSYADFGSWGTEVDVFGNVLAALGGLMDREEAEAMADAVLARGLHTPWPVRVVGNPIERGDVRWRPYMDRHSLNLPHRYHNGGVWPFVGCFWAILLHRLGRAEAAREALRGVARACELGEWGFFEWMDGRTGEPEGMRGQSWNAAAFLLARAVVEGGGEVLGASPWER